MLQDTSKTLFYALIALYGILILSTFHQYGITIDEPPQVAYGQAVFDWYFGQDKADDFFRKITQIDLELYGVLFNLVAYCASKLLPFDLYDTHHLINAIAGLLGVVAVYKIGTTLGTSSTGLLAAILLLLIPRYYGHAFNNPKDIPFAICYAWSLYHLIRGLSEIPHLSWKRIIFTGLSIGLTLSTRIGGLILFGYLGLFWTLTYFLDVMRTPRKKNPVPENIRDSNGFNHYLCLDCHARILAPGTAGAVYISILCTALFFTFYASRDHIIRRADYTKC